MRSYDFPLGSWIAASQVRDKLDEIVRRVNRDEPIDELLTARNLEYVGRIVKEEVTKQFPHKDRPVVEVVLNAVDANHSKGGERDVHVSGSAGRILVRDNGDSLGLEEILKFLILPFSTEKDDAPTGMYIGEFGVGFFSTLRYCIEDPGHGTVLVEANRNPAAYEAKFYATGSDTSSLRMRLRRRRPVRSIGTHVTIAKAFDLLQLEEYLRREVGSIPGFVAQIYYNKRLLNETRDAWHSVPVPLTDCRGRTYEQQVGLQRISQRKILITSRGVGVKSFDCAAGHGVRVMFPSLATLVIGRDEFKRDENYYRCVSASFLAVERLLRHDVQDAAAVATVRSNFIELVPSLLSALGLEGLSEIPNIGGIEETLLPGKRYVLLQKEIGRLNSFADTGDAFTASPQGCSVWVRRFRQYQDFLTERLSLCERATSQAFAQRLRSDLRYQPNLALLAEQDLTRYRISEVALVSARPPRALYMIDEEAKTLYINLEHQAIRGPADSLKRGLAYAIFLRLPAVRSVNRPEYIEQEMLRLSGRMIP